jgi:hypothetical protein
MLDPALTAALVLGSLFGAATLGMRLRARLPDHHLGDATKEAVRIGMGSVATMAALVLGLLVASTKSAYDTEKAEVIQMSAKVIYLDQLLANCGPPAAESRELLRRATRSALLRIWPESEAGQGTPAPATVWSRDLPQAIQRITTSDNAQRTFKSQAATAAELGQMRWLLFEQTQSSVSTPLLVIMVFWMALTYASIGLFAPPNGTAVTAQMFAALAVAGALFLILELDQPFDGLVRISSEPMVNALHEISK